MDYEPINNGGYLFFNRLKTTAFSFYFDFKFETACV